MSDVAVLTYFNGRGRAEFIRIVLCAANVKFREVHLTERDEFLKLLNTEGKLLFGQVPQLEIGGRTIVQSGAIVRHIAREYKLYGTSNAEATSVDELTDGARDFYTPLMGMLFAGDEATIISGFKQKQMPKYLKIYNEALTSNGNGYLVGKNLTLADLALLEVLLATEEFCGAASFDQYEAVKGFLAKMKALPQIQHYLINHRKPPNKAQYVETVERVLARK